MKKIIVSLSVVALVAVAAVGATRAVFNDSDSNTGNTFSTGSLVVKLDSETGSTGPFFNMSDMAPGDSVSKCVYIENTGSLDQIFRTYAESTSDTEKGTQKFSDQLRLTVVLRPSDCTPPSGFTPYGPPAGATMVNDQPLSSFIGVTHALDNSSAALNETPAWPLKQNYVAVYKMTVSLPKTTGNDWQGATFTGTLKVDATQAKNQTYGSVVW